MAKTLYETEYKKPEHFSFGQNWQDFLLRLTSSRIEIAKQSLEAFLGKDAVKGRSFLDIGCGSGLFSLAAFRLKAKRVVSVDIDDSSVSCVQSLKQKEGRPKQWEVKTASVLNQASFQRLGLFDIVYSWGVLHHTGDMYMAMKHAAQRVSPGGLLFIAIYNDYRGISQGSSRFWLKVKAFYNRTSPSVKLTLSWLYAGYLWMGLLISGRNPIAYIRNYQSMRGMSWWHDIRDWLGGYPYEYASPEEIVAYVMDLGFTVKKVHRVNSIGCNEYVFIKNSDLAVLPPVTVLLSSYNNGQSLTKTLKSVFTQTTKPSVVCINDASTDSTDQVLREWKKKVGNRLHIITNPSNLGLTKSLNKGLAAIATPYTARIDADDWWEKDKLEKQLRFLEVNKEYGVVGTWYTNHGHKKTYFVKPPMTYEEITHQILFQNPFAHSCVLFRTNLVQKLKGYDATVKYGQDYELWLRCEAKTKLFNLPQFLCHRAFTGGISIEKQREQMYYALRTRYRYIREHQLPLTAYYALVEPLLVYLTPRRLADLKRKWMDRV